MEASHISSPNLILASASPRRKAFLELLGIPFRVVPSQVEEVAQAGEQPEALVRRLALAKARSVCRHEPSAVALAADTLVWLLEGTAPTILGKPTDGADAQRMLRLLQGREHRVSTGYSLVSKARNIELTRVVTTRVEFAPMTNEEITAYVASGEPIDKAGAYAIQGIGGSFIKGIVGSYTNVVGLPVHEVLQDLRELKLWEPKQLMSTDD